MTDYSAFEVMGPIMVGPSSSHTAGACKIANVATSIVSNNYNQVEFQLHGSFAHTFKGHGTDRALVGGILGFEPDDDRIKTSFELAKQAGLNYIFTTTNLGDNYHPNSVKIVFSYPNGEEEYVIGSSIGGGAMKIVNINGIAIEFRGEYSTILLEYPEQRGVISYVSSLLTGSEYNIESLNTKKNKLTNIVTLTVEIDKPLTESLKSAILGVERFTTAKYVEV
ncbi:L-serine dehydratase [Peptoniphilus asaccharolyticus DSM 20463]|uniref:L-serine dehydratase, beta chain n=2 Tax=Peptoniphilus asaccharolyticus TaxID=1258 RepID=SDHB_PEPAS|nr:L-serine ammonia-lyase, iron-sulfur-dependent subunit beta [Peptoniphilus asaccharolyticus]P33074.2 RecName: Full=L-serine dehydratase, beta chain; Short=SDH; AltName: Full=L-serine deaminase; Short=L-SD [Peptoniphilus asaccharolyticus]AAC45545.1 beta-subunit of L-serine dehydratase [Peptoniphilus asaccharolyticus]MBL7576139.1 L-serine ammonia-lyase, iron-sulfur-dependent subunit beta [Peptoniphilus asaccharolyticus]SMB87566.1 L-serine dehydratase [Peptoniphilus asaccharolyticus DSM 20463]